MPFQNGISMTVKSQDPFFGSIGGMAAQLTGLTGTGIDGTNTPLFRSNIFDSRDPMMSSIEYRMSEAYSRRFADMQRKYSAAMSRSVDAMFNDSSAMGKFFYERDANGNFVQTPGTVKAFNMLRNAATSESGAGFINNISNNLLGYDRGAGMNVFAKNIDSIVARTAGFQNSMYTRKADGTLTYHAPDIEGDQYQASRTVAANMLTSSLQRVMYGDGMLKRYDTTHGLSEGLMARMMSDAFRQGAFDGKSTMSDKDRKTSEDIKRLQAAIESNNKEISNLTFSSGSRNATEQDRAFAGSEIDKYKKANMELRSQIDKMRSGMTSYDWDGDFESLVKEGMKDDANYRKLQEELGDAHKGTGIYGQIASVTDEIQMEMAGKSRGYERRVKDLQSRLDVLSQEASEREKAMDGIEKAQERTSEKIDGALESMSSAMSGAVKTAQAIFGSEEDTYNALYAVTGGAFAKDKRVAKLVDQRMQSFIDTGISMGLGNEQMSQLLQGAGMAVTGNRNVAAPYRNDSTSFWAAMRAAEGAARAQGRNDLTNAEKDSMPDAANWLAATNDQSTMMNAMFMVRKAFEDGDLSQKQYDRLMADLQSGDDETRAAAFKSLSNNLFDGDINRAMAFLKNEQKMAIVRDKTSEEGKEEIHKNFETGSRNETNATKALTAQNQELQRERKFAEESGTSSEDVDFISNKGMLEGMRNKMSELAQAGNPQAASVLSALDEKITTEIRKGIESGKTEEEATRDAYSKASEWMNETGTKVLGTAATDVKKAGMEWATQSFRDRGNVATAVGSVNGKLLDFLSTQEGSTADKDAENMSSRNLLKTGNFLFSDDVKNLMISEESQEMFDRLSEQYKDAVRSGDTSKAARIASEMYNSLGDNERAMVDEQFSKNVSFDSDKKKQNAKEGKHSTIDDIEKTAAALAARGEEFNTTTYNAMMNSAILQAEKDPEEEKKLQDKREERAKRAYEKNSPGAESIMQFLEGDASFVNIFKNGNISDEEFHSRIGDLATGLGLIGGGTEDTGFLDMFTKKGAQSVSEGAIAKSIMKMGGEEAFSFAKLLGMDDNNWGDSDAKGFAESMNKFQNATLSKDKQKHLSEGLGRVIDAVQQNVDKYRNAKHLTQEEKETLAAKAQNLEKLQAIKDAVDSGELDVGGVGKKDRGSGGGGVSSGAINDLIAKIGELISTLNNHVGDGTYSK